MHILDFVLTILCPALTVSDVTSANGKYIWVPTVTDWATGESYCNTQYQSSLASIHSAADNTEISSLCANSASACYIGLNDQITENSFVWIDASNRDYTASTFPLDNHNHGGYDEDCVIVFTDGSWGDTPCHTSHPYSFICNAPTQEVYSVNGKYIWVGPSITDWFTAESFCSTQYQTSLASIHSAADNTEISNLCVANSAENACYIGLNDQSTENSFVWIDGSNRDYTAATFPLDNADHGGYDEDCVIVFTDGAWGDTPCHISHPYSFICNAPTQEVYSANGKYIWVGPSITDSSTAASFCNTQYDTSLASIHSAADNTEISSLCANSAENACYIGLTDSSVEGQFSWMDGTVYDYIASSFETGNTDHGGYDEDCVIVFTDGSWADTPCHTSHPYSFICNAPTPAPTKVPSANPTQNPSDFPSSNPSERPTKSPTRNPSVSPTTNPSRVPTGNPSVSPTRHPTIDPSNGPTSNPNESVTNDPTTSPTMIPTEAPSSTPSMNPSENPSKVPTQTPSIIPSETPSMNPTGSPTRIPSDNPTANPSDQVIDQTASSDEDTTTTQAVNVQGLGSMLSVVSSAWICFVWFLFS